MKLYVIRHGETEMGKNEIIATEDEPLNKFGMNQAQKVGKELKKLDIDIIYCSPIERAKHTLKLFDMDKNIPVIIDERIKERNMGIYEKVPFNELDWDVFWNYNSDIKYQEQYIGILMEYLKMVIHQILTKIVKYMNTNYNRSNF